MVRVGVIGLGFMGQMHLKTYQQIEGVEVVAISDQNEKRVQGDLSGGWGNMDSGDDQLDMTNIVGLTDWRELIALEQVDLIDICVPTPGHSEVVLAALATGKHVVCEKPLCTSSQEAAILATAADRATGFFMPAMCIRFWPGWAELKELIAEETYGRLLGLQIRRVSGTPGRWFHEGDLSGGALVDLHIHDTDFVNYLFGRPRAVYSRGYAQHSGRTDHIVTQYVYDQVPLVVAEGAWLASEFPFAMSFVANFESATVSFDTAQDEPLQITQDGKVQTKSVEGDGYLAQLQYLVDCIQNNTAPTIVSAQDAVSSLEIIEAEQRSLETGTVVSLA